MALYNKAVWTEKSKEYTFDMFGEKVVYYYDLEKTPSGMYKFMLHCKGQDTYHISGNDCIQLALPQCVIIELVGMNAKHRYLHSTDRYQRWHKDKVLKKRLYLETRFIGRVIGSDIFKRYIELSGDSIDNIKVMYGLMMRLNPHRRGRKMNLKNNIWRADSLNFGLPAKFVSQELFDMFIKDMRKYHPVVSRHVIEQLKILDVISADVYRDKLVTLPDIVKLNRHNLTFLPDANLDKFRHRPRTKFQWYMFNVLTHAYGGYQLTGNTEFPMVCQLAKADKGLWALWKKLRRLASSTRYSLVRLANMIDVVNDGIRMHRRYVDNNDGIKFVRVDGSAANMLRAAVFNHHQERRYQERVALSKPNRTMALPPVKLPDWIEEIRIKTTHEIIVAGLECEHCLGSYSDSNDIFVRLGDVCAQIHENDLTVGQCYDIRDTITKASKSLKRRLNSSLVHCREQLQK